MGCNSYFIIQIEGRVDPEVLANKKELFTQIGFKPLTFRPHNTAALPIRHLIILGILEILYLCVDESFSKGPLHSSIHNVMDSKQQPLEKLFEMNYLVSEDAAFILSMSNFDIWGVAKL